MDNNNTALAGEFFVAAELSKKNFQVAITHGNAKEIDLFVRTPKKKIIAVQVKTLRGKNCYTLSSNKIFPNEFYVFVRLNEEKESPEYFILKGAELLADMEHFYGSSLNVERETVNYGPLIPHKDRWDKLEQ